MSRPYADNDPFQAISHATRRRLLDLLRRKPHTVGELLEHFHMSGATLTHHLRILRSAQLITQKRAGRRRIYEVQPRRLRVITSWLRSYRAAK